MYNLRLYIGIYTSSNNSNIYALLAKNKEYIY